MQETSDYHRSAAIRDSLEVLLPAAVLIGSVIYFACMVSVHEASVLESQDLGIACDLFKTFGMSPDHSPLHFVFMNLWERLDSTSFAFLRVPSVVFCGLATLVVHHLAKRLAGPVAGVLGAVLFATNPLVVDNARSTRMYSLNLLFGAACLLFAYLYLARSRRTGHLVGFATSSILAIYNYLFMWLLVGSLVLLFGLDLYTRRDDQPETRRAVKTALIGAVLLIPQMVHIFAAVGFTKERHSLYRGLSSQLLNFLVPVGQTLFWGEIPPQPLSSPYLLAFPLVLVLLGIAWSNRMRRLSALVLLLPSLSVAWYLSRSSQVEPRYLNYLSPVIAVLMAVGLARMRRIHWWGPVALAMTGMFAYSTHLAYAGPVTDWPEAAAYIQAIRRPDDVVAVFPEYWSPTFLRYSQIADVAPFTQTEELDRILTRGGRVILVRNSGRYFENVEAFLRVRTRTAEVFKTAVRDVLRVYVVEANPPAKVTPRRIENPSVVLAGLVGSGGYPWQNGPESAHPFERLRDLFRSADLTLTGYVPYHPPWYRRLLLGSDDLRALRPNAEVARKMNDAGIQAVAMCASGAAADEATEILAATQTRTIAPQGDQGLTRPVVFKIGDVQLAVLNVGTQAWRRWREAATSGDRAVVALEQAITTAKRAAGAGGRLLLVMPEDPDYGRLLDAQDQRVARQAIEKGADVVVGIGGFAAKEIEEYRGGIIAYSLGTLVRPPVLGLTMLDSSGIALWLAFPKGEKATYEVFPITFDDQVRPAIGRRESVEHLVLHQPVNPPSATVSLTDRLRQAEVGYRSHAGENYELRDWSSKKDPLVSPLQERIQASVVPIETWFPTRPRLTPLRPFYGAFAGHGVYCGLRGVLSMGDFRRAIELEPGGNESAWVLLRQQPMGARLEVTYGLPDDHMARKFRPFNPQTLVVSVGGEQLLEATIPYVAGWKTFSADTSRMIGRAADIRVVVQTNATHFPVAFDLVVHGAGTRP